MEKKNIIYCDCHPTRRAHWRCNQCGALFCSQCVDVREQETFGNRETLHFCSKCNLPADWMGAANLIDPFWNRLPAFFFYPFSSPHPAILLGLAALLAVLFHGRGIFSWVIHGLSWLIVLKYSFEILKSTGSGNLTPPKLSARTLSDDLQEVFKQFAIYILIYFASGWMSVKLGAVFGIGFLYGAFFFIPAMVILLVSTGSFLHAINPVVFAGLVFRIGWGYLLMVFFLTLMGSAPALLAKYFGLHISEYLALPLFRIAKCYYLMISYHMMGYVLLQYHEQIGYEVKYEDFHDPSFTKATAVSADPDAAVLREIGPLIQEGKLAEAVTVIKDMIKRDGVKGLNLSRRFYKLLQMQNLSNDLIEHGRRHLDLLVEAEQKNEALKVYTHCRTLHSEFLPSASVLFKLGGWLNENGKSKAAVGVLNQLVKAYPHDPLVPRAFFRAAQIFNDRLLNSDNTRKILNLIQTRFPDHEIIPQVEKYRAHL